MPGIAGLRERPLDVAQSSSAVDEICDHDRGRDAERNLPERQDEEHRHEQELGWHRKARTDLEVEPPRGGVGRDQREVDECRRRAVAGKQEREGDGDRRESAAEHGGRDSLAPPEAALSPLALSLDWRVLVENRMNPLGVGRRRHTAQVVLTRARLEEACVQFTRSRDAEARKGGCGPRRIREASRGLREGGQTVVRGGTVVVVRRVVRYCLCALALLALSGSTANAALL